MTVAGSKGEGRDQGSSWRIVGKVWRWTKCCTIMAQAEVAIDRSKADVATRFKERLEVLFNVKATVCLTRQCSLVEDGSDASDEQATFGLLLSTSDSQENIEKAIVSDRGFRHLSV